MYGSVIAAVGRGKGWDAIKKAEKVYADYAETGQSLDKFIVGAMLAGAKHFLEEWIQ